MYGERGTADACVRRLKWEQSKIFPFRYSIPSLCLSLFDFVPSPAPQISLQTTNQPLASGETRRISFESVSASCFTNITYGVRR